MWNVRNAPVTRTGLLAETRSNNPIGEPARPAADILGDHLPVQARAAMFPLHHEHKVIRSAERHRVVALAGRHQATPSAEESWPQHDSGSA